MHVRIFGFFFINHCDLRKDKNHQLKTKSMNFKVGLKCAQGQIEIW